MPVPLFQVHADCACVCLVLHLLLVGRIWQQTPSPVTQHAFCQLHSNMQPCICLHLQQITFNYCCSIQQCNHDTTNTLSTISNPIDFLSHTFEIPVHVILSISLHDVGKTTFKLNFKLIYTEILLQKNLQQQQHHFGSELELLQYNNAKGA